VFESEKEPAAREEFREQDRGQVELINNAFRQKRKPAVAISATHATRSSRAKSRDPDEVSFKLAQRDPSAALGMTDYNSAIARPSRCAT
jgi:hypothetical protein